MKQVWVTLLLIGLVMFGLNACGQREQRVFLAVDGEVRVVVVPPEFTTVAQALAYAQVKLGDLDRVEPASYSTLSPDLRIVVTRVRERQVVLDQPVPYERQVRRDATLPRGQTRLQQLGQNGVQGVTYLLRYENALEVERRIVASTVLTPAIPEILIMGTKGGVGGVPISGTLAYLAAGNAWVIRQDSGLKRALTPTGDLDGHVFSLSPDGRWLLFSRRPLGGGAGLGGPLNSLWLTRTDIVNAEPIYLRLDSVLWAEWHPEAGALAFAYSTAERVPTAPGWRAKNDLLLVSLDPTTQRLGEPAQLHPEERSSLYAWWGRSWRWAPDGQRLLWANATTVGLTTTQPKSHVLFTFSPYETPGTWVWTPRPAWRHDGQGYALVVHRLAYPGSADKGLPDTQPGSARFDLWFFPTDADEGELLHEQVGMWAMPEWSRQGRLAYGQAEDTETSMSSRYRLMVTDHTGHNPEPLFPAPEQPGVDVPWIAWSPQGDQLVTVWQEDLFLIDVASKAAQPLTIEGGASRPQWR